MKDEKEIVFNCLKKEGILKIFETLNRVYCETIDGDLKIAIKPALDTIAIPISTSKKTKKELSEKGNLNLTKPPFSTLLNFVSKSGIKK
jgi:hypothetical protein